MMKKEAFLGHQIQDDDYSEADCLAEVVKIQTYQACFAAYKALELLGMKVDLDPAVLALEAAAASVESIGAAASEQKAFQHLVQTYLDQEAGTVEKLQE